MPLKTLIKYQQGLFMHSIYHKYCPSSLHNTWSTVAERNGNYNLRNAEDLYVPLAINKQLRKLPFFTFPKMWNDLNVMKLTPNPTTFKIFLKDLLLSDESE
jgi:hypothetical protein